MPPSSDAFCAVVPAAGIGKRMQSDIPKQYLSLAGKTILEHCLLNLIAHPRIQHIILALHPQDPWFNKLGIASVPWLTVINGGKERADSVLNGLQQARMSEWVLVHDAARPCLPHTDIDKLLALAGGNEGGILATPVRDTMKRADEQGLVLRTEEREHLWHALTPQFFPRAQLQHALSNALAQNISITDEASAIEWAGGKVRLVQGDPCNIKITHPEDLALAEFYLQRMKKTRGNMK
ncbi:2-C-methyl-D-erythritol 4-phosphate cytidylyltransferase [Lacimicrobium alkaliphilum]|uniref:2-C-methyl-D-erythritol 4-phosphate cytidylyltransferase n=1 Tax=Lacimicrobium alkaliphilum TaxID=1526571 RepID=A0A0U3BFV6_9ALTE|nr:2-C-methyl-D-erythritol 4-phosphate cytidylyltransferase [Lacimicrobium alkaliphilum]ALT00502.1 2-C-methyl-D-erythritol 4-phosphate cytidylyltransferase [Lacimicrobium alkaliphilum]